MYVGDLWWDGELRDVGAEVCEERVGGRSYFRGKGTK